jgi:hypothetical protein
MKLSKQLLQSKAFSIFRAWTVSARLSHPELNLTSRDEIVLCATLTEAIRKARTSLLKEEKADRRKIIGYGVGFMLGFIESNLNVAWHFEFILKQSKAHKEFIALKAIKQYFEQDELARIRVSAMYNALYIEDMNIENASASMVPERIKQEGIADDEMPYENQILQMLNNKINSYINDYLEIDGPNFMPPMENYFSVDELRSLIENGVD